MEDANLIALSLQILINIAPQLMVALKKGGNAWKDLPLGSLMITEDYAAVEARIRASMTNNPDTKAE